MFRLAVFAEELHVNASELCVDGCVCFLASAKPLAEVWVRCVDVNAMASVLEQILRASSILVFGTLRGRVVLPAPKLSIEDIALEDAELPSRVEVEIVERAALRRLVELPISEANIDVRSGRGVISFGSPHKASQLFDIGIRVLKPAEIPPKPGTVLAALRRASRS